MGAKICALYLLTGVVAFLGGCGGPKQSAVINPYQRTFDRPIPEKITVFIDPSIPEAMAFGGAGLRTLTMSDFKTVFKNGLTNMFSKNFAGVDFTEVKPQQGIALMFYRLEGAWDKRAAVAGEGGQVANYEVRPLFKFDVALFRDGGKIAGLEGEIAGENSTASLFNLAPVFIGGTKTLCEELGRAIFTDEVIAALSSQVGVPVVPVAEAAALVAAPAPETPCTKDTECSGDMVCKDERCTAP
jgi:hypothetical protein